MTHHYSASQYDTFTDCQRKWGFRYRDGIKAPAHPSAVKGTKCHDAAEAYLKHGTPYDPDTDEGKIMLPGLKYLPQPGQASVEEELLLHLPGVGEVTGFIDALYKEEAQVVVHDHKTTSNFKWAKTQNDLPENAQAVIYSAYAMEKFEVDEVLCRWVYHISNPKRPSAMKVETKLHVDQIQKPWNRIVDTFKQMREYHDQGAKAHDLPHNVEACERYGGCPYRSECNLSMTDRLKGHRKMAKLAMLERMKKKNEAKAPDQAAPAPEPEEKKVKPEEKEVKHKPTEPEKPKKKYKSHQAPGKGTQADISMAEKQKPKKPRARKGINPPPPSEAEFALPPEANPAKETGPAYHVTSGFILCIDCNPVKGSQNTAMFGDLIAPVLATLKNSHGRHYRLIENTFGGAPAIFSEALDEHLKKNPPHGAVFMSLASVEARDALEVMVKHAGLVVKA